VVADLLSKHVPPGAEVEASVSGLGVASLAIVEEDRSFHMRLEGGVGEFTDSPPCSTTWRSTSARATRR
jgi:hypothetical protein